MCCVTNFIGQLHSCSVDTENACVAVEGVDPTTIEVCRFYKRGNCWRGDKCPYSHQKNSYTGELKTEMAVSFFIISNSA